MAAAFKRYISTALAEAFSYIKNPQENLPVSYRPKSILQSWCAAAIAVVAMMLAIVIIFVVIFAAFSDLVTETVISKPVMPWWVMVLLGPLIEELTFRLPLVRRKAFIAAALFLVSFNLISRFAFSHQFYTTDFLLERAGVSLAAGAVLFFALNKWMSRCSYRGYFYFWAVLFGSAHLFRIDFGTFLPLDYFIVLLYVAKQTVMGLLLGYMRNRNGIASSILFHILNNAIG